MRTCLVVIGVIVAIAAAGAGFAVYTLNNQFGYTMAEPISFETRIEENTRIQAVLNVDTLRDYAVELLPEDIPQLPEWLPYNLHEIMHEVLPRELALLAGANFDKNAIDLTVFANERRIGPVIVEQLRAQGVLSNITQVQWEPELFQLEERGVITARGVVPLPDRAEQLVMDNSEVKEGRTTRSISGNNLLEVIADGRGGDLVALYAAYVSGQAAQQGVDMDTALTDPNAKTGLMMVSSLDHVYVDANFTGKDEVTVNMKLVLFDDAPSTASFLLRMGIADQNFELFQNMAQQNYGLSIEYKDGKAPEWLDDQTLAGSFVVSGFRQRIENQINTALALDPPPTAS